MPNFSEARGLPPPPRLPPLGWDTNTTIDPEWSKEETDYLFQIIEDYDSRFLVVHDRYEFPGGVPRSLEVRIAL
jgi:hypothetical protein